MKPTITNRQVLEIRIAAQKIHDKITRVAADRDSAGFYSICDEAMQDDQAHLVIGCIRAYRSKSADTFEWFMYCLSAHKGYEEILANYWLSNWQIKCNGCPTLGVDVLIEE